VSNREKNNDLFLIERYRGGDKSALDTLIKRYQNRLYNTILKMCASPEDALELTQDSFVKVIENIDKFQGKSSFYTYLFRVGVNLTINFCNRRKKVRFATIDAETENADGRGMLKDYLEGRGKDDPADIVSDKEAVDILRRAIASLEDKYREVLVLRDIEEMTYEQIAQTLELEAGTVKSRLFRARAMLKDILESKLGDEN
jgi:RNA polymerase sigma-70 factor (ECF subfamily)